MWNQIDVLRELLDEEVGKSLPSDSYVKVSGSGKKQGFGLPLEDESDNEEGLDVIELPHFQAPLSGGLSGPEVDVEEGEGEDDEGSEPAIRAPRFEFVERKLGWEDRHPGVPDNALAQQYKTTRDPQILESIFSRNQDHLSYSARQLQAYRLPTPATAAMTYNSFVHSLKRWDPEGGRNLRNWHKADAFPNAKTRARTLGQFTKADRSRISKIELTQQVRRDFEAEYSRFPTVKELEEASAGALKAKDIRKILLEDRGKLLGSKDLEADSNVDVQRATLRAVQRSQEYYNSRHKKMLDAMWGLGGETEITSNNALAEKFGVTPQYMSTLKRRFLSDIQDELRQMGV